MTLVIVMLSTNWLNQSKVNQSLSQILNNLSAVMTHTSNEFAFTRL